MKICNWFDRWTDEQRHAHTLQAISIQNRAAQRKARDIELGMERIAQDRDTLLHACRQALSSARMARVCGNDIDPDLLERLMSDAIDNIG